MQFGLVSSTRLPKRSVKRSNLTIVNSGNFEKTDTKKVPVQTVGDETLKNNLLGKSRYMKDKNWVDSSGRQGRGMGVYRFADKYGANVDGYSPIYTPDIWVDANSQFQLGTKGLIAWAGLLVTLLAVGINLIVSTSQLGQ